MAKYVFTDKKSTFIIWLIIAVLGLALLAVKYSDRTRADRLAELDGFTTAKVNAIEENDNIQGENNVVVDSYTIEYEYNVDDQVHYGRDDLEGIERHQSFVEEILNSGFKQKIQIKYDTDNPATSLIIPPGDEQ